jgi:hypothetical protein
MIDAAQPSAAVLKLERAGVMPSLQTIQGEYFGRVGGIIDVVRN